MRTPVCPSYAGYRFPAEVISHAVWLYYGRSPRDKGLHRFETGVGLGKSLGAIAARKQATAAQIAIAWLLKEQSHSASVISVSMTASSMPTPLNH